MRAAGIREARQSLSVLLEDVRQGHEIVITDRGKPVARLVAPLPLSAKPFLGRRDVRRKTPRLRPPLSSRIVGEASRPVRRRVRAADVRGGAIPGPVYLDSSALAQIYFREPPSDALDDALLGRRDLTVSDLAVTELLAALSGRRLAPGQSEGVAAARASLLGDLDAGIYRRAEIAPATHRAAERLLLSATRPLRAADALHLALAMTAGVASFLTYDRHRAWAAGGLGLRAIP
jgi:uncharacterized protein